MKIVSVDSSVQEKLPHSFCEERAIEGSKGSAGGEPPLYNDSWWMKSMSAKGDIINTS